MADLVASAPPPPALELRPINTNVSFRDQAYAALKQAITNADIYAHPDEIRLDERQLAESLGVSRTPIREAMTLLEQEGFLRTVPRRGVFVVRKTKKQIVEMIEMWAALESMAARLATVNASDEDIAGLRHMFDEFLNSTPAQHIEEYSDANIAFHQAIIRLSGSHLMGQTIENLFIHVRAIRRLTISQSDRAARSIEDHMRIIEALEQRDTELAERLVRQHSLDLAAYVHKHCDFLDSKTVTATVDVSRLGKRKGVRPHPKGRPVDPVALDEVRAALADAPRRPDLLIEHLHRIQDTYGCLRAAHLVALAQELRLAMTEVYEVASFYHHFDIVKEGDTPPPPITVRVCETLSCAMAGSHELLAATATALGDGVRVIPAPCIGRCEHAPAAVVGRNPVDRATVETLASAVREARIEAPIAPYVDYAQYRAEGGYATWRACLGGERSVDDVIATLESSALRGLGGAGFPAGRKWKIVRAEPAPRLMAVNIDEGEPGTFKDRFYLERDPHRFIEGMLIAAWAVGIESIYIYLRDEYAGCRDILARELTALTADPPGPLPHIELRRGAGAYICGEESAMIESIEGKRGMPRLRPPYVAQVGLFGRPTLEHNMETLFWVRDILEKGGEWFAGQGRHGRKGLRSFSVSGRVQKPGVHLAPAGITVRELIDEHCGGMLPGHDFYGYLPGGASGGILPASMGDIPLDFDTLQPHGCFIGSAAVVILSQHDRARDAALNLMRFFADESCGQCTPCRVGTDKAVALMQRPQWDLPLLADLSRAMADASICGLGQAAPNPIACVVKYFPHELHGTRA